MYEHAEFNSCWLAWFVSVSKSLFINFLFWQRLYVASTDSWSWRWRYQRRQIVWDSFISVHWSRTLKKSNCKCWHWMSISFIPSSSKLLRLSALLVLSGKLYSQLRDEQVCFCLSLLLDHPFHDDHVLHGLSCRFRLYWWTWSLFQWNILSNISKCHLGKQIRDVKLVGNQ